MATRICHGQEFVPYRIVLRMIEVASLWCMEETGGSSQDTMLYAYWPQYLGMFEESCHTLSCYDTVDQLKRRPLKVGLATANAFPTLGHRTGESFEHPEVEKARAGRQ